MAPMTASTDPSATASLAAADLPLRVRRTLERALTLVSEELDHGMERMLLEFERELFRLLIGVSGVGANTARVILSSKAPAELETVIATADERQLKAVKGVGAKTAQRIIVDLRDKIKPVDSSLIIERTATTDAFNEGLAALTMLGFQRQASEKVLKKLFADDPTLRVESAIKQALKML